MHLSDLYGFAIFLAICSKWFIVSSIDSVFRTLKIRSDAETYLPGGDINIVGRTYRYLRTT
jgi:hypothetical protein